MSNRSPRLESFLAEQNRLDIQNPEEREQAQVQAKAQARTFFDQVVMPALSALAIDLDQQADRTAKADVLSKSESDDFFVGELRVDYDRPGHDGRGQSEFVCRIDVRVGRGSLISTKLTTPRLQDGRPTPNLDKVTLSLDVTGKQIANDVLREYLTISGALRELVRNRSPRPERERRR